MSISQYRREDSIFIDEHNAPPGLLESWAEYHDYLLELEFGPQEPPQEPMHSD